MVSVSITQRGKASFRLRTKWRDTASGELREINETVKGSREFAEAKKEIIVRRFKTGQMVSLSNETVKGYLLNWIDKRVMFGDIRPTTAQTYISMLPNFTDQYGDTLLVALSASNLRDWVSQTIVTKGAYTTRFVGVIVKKALKQAVKDGMIAYSPFENVDLPPRKHEQKEATLDTDTVRKAWEASYAHEHGLAVRLGFETGARRGELAALRWSDISAEGSVSISRTVVSLRGGEIAVNEPKTRQSRRKVRVSDSLKDEVNRLRKGKVSTHYIFGGVEPPHPALISRTIQSVLTTIGMGDFSAHDLRHAHATHLLRSRLSPAAVSKRLGHAKTSTTLDIYAHAMEEDEDDIISAVNNVLGPDRTQKSAEQSEETIS